jgi:hypothetical protein
MVTIGKISKLPVAAEIDQAVDSVAGGAIESPEHPLKSASAIGSTVYSRN